MAPSNPFGTETLTHTSWEIGARAWSNSDGKGILRTEIAALNALAVRSLISLFNEKEGLFSARVTLVNGGYSSEEASLKRSAIALLGICRLIESGETLHFDVASMQDIVFRDRRWVKTIGDLGLLTWFTSVCVPDRLGAVFSDFDFEGALANYKDGRQARTTRLACFLAGIAHARIAHREAVPELTDVAVDTYRLLLDNQGEDGIFGHAASAPFPIETLYGRFGTFSDQIFPIYALSMFARAFQIEEPLEPALACGNSLCALQGQLGQWWFLYDKSSCRVVSRYPVVSLHQYGTAPLGLLALEEATGRSFQRPISKGLSWIAGANELDRTLSSEDRAFIWDSIGPRGRLARYREAALGFLLPSRKTDVGDLRIRCEARPDHFGWLLYAFGSCGLPKQTPELVAENSD